MLIQHNVVLFLGHLAAPDAILVGTNLLPLSPSKTPTRCPLLNLFVVHSEQEGRAEQVHPRAAAVDEDAGPGIRTQQSPRRKKGRSSGTCLKILKRLFTHAVGAWTCFYYRLNREWLVLVFVLKLLEGKELSSTKWSPPTKVPSESLSVDYCGALWHLARGLGGSILMSRVGRERFVAAV
jgi:hypothetical protein